MSNRGRNGSRAMETADENLQLFSEVSKKLLIKMDNSDLLSFSDVGKHDYDWLLTPPGSPLVSKDGLRNQHKTAEPRSSSVGRNGSSMKTSRLSVTQAESTKSPRSARSRSVTRPSVSASQYNSYSLNRSSSSLNTSSASISSYIRPSSPTVRSPSVGRPSSSSSRPSLSRPTTPSRVPTTPRSSSVDKPRPLSNSRPSTPTSRIQNPPNLTSPGLQSNSRPSTPNRRVSAPSLSTMGIATIPGRRLSSSGVTTSSTARSRPSSPSPRLNPLQQPSVNTSFPQDTPPNLRTTLPDRPLSAGRSRPGLSVMGKGKTDTLTIGNSPRRQPSPVTTRGRLSEPFAKACAQSNGRAEVTEAYKKTTNLQDSIMNKSIRILSDNNGFGRTISKKSLDMDGRHMDLRNGAGNSRQLSGTTLFPQSIRSSAGVKAQAIHASSDFGSSDNHSLLNSSGYFENKRNVSALANGRNEEISHHLSGKFREVDTYGSSRYDAILLEDIKNTNWLHSFDENSDQGSLFDSSFETLPEPFDPL